MLYRNLIKFWNCFLVFTHIVCFFFQSLLILFWFYHFVVMRTMVYCHSISTIGNPFQRLDLDLKYLRRNIFFYLYLFYLYKHCFRQWLFLRYKYKEIILTFIWPWSLTGVGERRWLWGESDHTCPTWYIGILEWKYPRDLKIVL